MIDNFPMAAEQNSQPPEKGECMAEQNGWHYKHKVDLSSESSMDDDQLCENVSEADDNEEDCSDDKNDGTIEDADPVLPVFLNIDGRIEHTQNFGAVTREDSMLVDSSEGDKLQGTVDFGQNSLSSEREQVHGRTLDELLVLYGHEGSLEDYEDDNGWSPYGDFAVHTKWFCINCTMPNLDDTLHCGMCGEHRESGILNEGYLAPAEVSGSSKLSLEMPENSNGVATCITPTPTSATGELSTLPLPERRTVIGFDERMLLHSEAQMKSHPHPERPDRLRAIAASLRAAGIFPGKVFPIPAREVTLEELQNIHSPQHVSAVETTSCRLSSYFTADTYANEHSALAARLAAGLCANLATAVVREQAQNGFALVRPPGHHAGITDVMGFCLHNNAAIAARAAQAAGAKKVLIVDWDVHHGNGTQEIFERDNSVLYISLHRHEGGRFYPGTGAANEVGSFDGEGFSVNIPWKCGGVGDEDYIFAFQHVVLLIAEQFAPDLTIISAGFDAARGDPLGGCQVTPFGFAYMTKMLSDLFKRKLLVILEGGYNLRSISASATAVVKVLLGENMGFDTVDIKPSKSCLETLLEVLEIQSLYWHILKGCYLRLRTQWEALYPTKRVTEYNTDVQYLEVERAPVHSTNLEEQTMRTSVSPDMS